MLALYEMVTDQLRPTERPKVGVDAYLLLYLQREPEEVSLQDSEAYTAFAGGTLELVPRLVEAPDRVVLVGGWCPRGWYGCPEWAAFLWGWRLVFHQVGRVALEVGRARMEVEVANQSDFEVAGKSGDFQVASGSGFEVVSAQLVYAGGGRRLYLVHGRMTSPVAVFDPRSTLSETAVLHIDAEHTESFRIGVRYDREGNAHLFAYDWSGQAVVPTEVFRLEVWTE